MCSTLPFVIYGINCLLFSVSEIKVFVMVEIVMVKDTSKTKKNNRGDGIGTRQFCTAKTC